MARTVVDEEEKKPIPVIEIGFDRSEAAGTSSAASDPFAAKIEDIKKVDGLSQAAKRRGGRELQKFHRGSDGAESKKIEGESLYNNGYTLFDVVLPPNNLDHLAALYEINSAHFAAVNAKVANIVGLGFDWEETIKTRETLANIKGEEKLNRARRKLEQAKDELSHMLDDFHEEDTFIETLSKVWTDVETTGNGYIEIGRKSVGGQIGYVGHVPAATIRVRRKRDGFVQMYANKAVFFRNFGDTKTPNPVGDDRRPNELIHIKKYSPTNSYYGIPDILAAKNAVAGAEFAARYNLDYFEHKAVPRYIIVIKGAQLSAASERGLNDFFQTNLKGKNHRSMYIPLPDKESEFKMEPVEAGKQDSSFTQYNKDAKIEVLMVHRVPIGKVSAAEGQSLAAARDADKTFKEQVTRPSQKILEKKVNRIIHELTDIFRLKFNELTLTDEDTQSKIDERYLRMQTVVPNEVRRRMGLPGIPGGDKVVDLKPQQAAEAKTQATGNRTRDQNRSAAAPDSDGEARNPKGEGRSTS